MIRHRDRRFIRLTLDSTALMDLLQRHGYLARDGYEPGPNARVVSVCLSPSCPVGEAFSLFIEDELLPESHKPLSGYQGWCLDLRPIKAPPVEGG